jgi:hypothetical protein
VAVFKGESTQRAPAGEVLPLQDEAVKLVRANPRFIRRRGESAPSGVVDSWSVSWWMNEWDLEIDPTDARFLCYRVHVFQEAAFQRGRFVPVPRWAVVVSLNINDSLRRVFPTLAKAMVAFDAIKSMTTVKTLMARGFRQW